MGFLCEIVLLPHKDLDLNPLVLYIFYGKEGSFFYETIYLSVLELAEVENVINKINK